MTNDFEKRDKGGPLCNAALMLRQDEATSMPTPNWPTPSQRALLRASFARLIPESDLAVEEFYRDLFERHPSVRTLFPEDLSAMHEKFMQMLAWFIDHLDRPEAAAKACARLGERHREYGAESSHYAPVGEILLEVLAHRAKLDAAEKQAWAEMYATMSQLMLAGAAPSA